MTDSDFFDFVGEDDEQDNIEIVEEVKPKYKLDISEVLSAIDYKKYEFLSTKSAEEAKAFAPIVALRFAASIDDRNKNNLSNIKKINERVNKNFWDLYKHPELQFKLMASCGIGSKTYHPWIANKSDKLNEDIIVWMRHHHVLVSDEELHIKISKMSIEEIDKYIEMYAVTKQQRSELLESYGKLTNQSDAITSKLEAEKVDKRRKTSRKTKT